MSPAGLVAPSRLPPPVEGHEHLPAAVLPAQRGVRVVAILFDALLELAVGAVFHLERRGGGGESDQRLFDIVMIMSQRSRNAARYIDAFLQTQV